MARLATVIWIMMGITFAGAFALVVLSVPSLAREATETLPWAALAGFVLAIPASIYVARRILQDTGPR